MDARKYIKVRLRRRAPVGRFGRRAEVGFDFGVLRTFDGIPWRGTGLRNESQEYWL